MPGAGAIHPISDETRLIVVSRAWRKVKVDWDAWCVRNLADEDIVRLILDGTVIRTRLDRKAVNISVLAAIDVRRDGQKGLLSIRNMGGESTAAWRQFLDDLDARGLITAASYTDLRPVTRGDGGDAFRSCDKCVPSVAAGGDDAVVAFEDALREVVLAEELPDVFDRVQFRAVGR